MAAIRRPQQTLGEKCGLESPAVVSASRFNDLNRQPISSRLAWRRNDTLQLKTMMFNSRSATGRFENRESATPPIDAFVEDEVP